MAWYFFCKYVWTHISNSGILLLEISQNHVLISEIIPITWSDIVAKLSSYMWRKRKGSSLEANQSESCGEAVPFIYKHEAGDRKASLGDALGTNVCSEGSVPGKTQVEVEGLQIVWLGKSLYIQISVSVQFSSVQFSYSVVSDCLRPHELQHARPPCPSQTPGVYSNTCLSSQWCHPAISSSVVPFSSCPQSLPATGSFPMSQLFTRGGQSTGVSASASDLPTNTQDLSPLGWTGWISLQSKGLWVLLLGKAYVTCGTLATWNLGDVAFSFPSRIG